MKKGANNDIIKTDICPAEWKCVQTESQIQNLWLNSNALCITPQIKARLIV